MNRHVSRILLGFWTVFYEVVRSALTVTAFLTTTYWIGRAPTITATILILAGLYLIGQERERRRTAGPVLIGMEAERFLELTQDPRLTPERRKWMDELARKSKEATREEAPKWE